MIVNHLRNIPTMKCPANTPPGAVGFIQWVSDVDGDHVWASARIMVGEGSRDRINVMIEHNGERRQIYRSQFLLLLSSTPSTPDVLATFIAGLPE